jgi:signal transduction histidine kinase
MRSIRRQLTVTMLRGFGWLLVLSSIAIYFFTRVALVNEFDAGLRAQALAIVSMTEQGHDGIQVEVPEVSSGGTATDVAPRFYEVWQASGESRARSPSLENAHLTCFFGRRGPVFSDVDLPGGHAGRAIGLKFTPKAEDEDAKPAAPVEAIIVVAADRANLDRTLRTLAAVLVAAGILTVAITVPLVRTALRRGHAPLELLASQAAAITADSLQSRFPVDSMPEELLPIATRLNDLLGRLETSFERERRFSADLAHELRTPLAELRSHAEVELEWPEVGGAEKHRETLNIALQMEAMVTRLLQMTRCEEGGMSIKLEAVALAPLIDEVWRPLAASAKEKQLAFEFIVPNDAVIQTDRTLFRSILVNLLSNAVQYTPPNGRGVVHWDSDAGELTISNTASDLNAADLPHLFERLWRKDKSRTGQDHCGLGLALSRAFAHSLGFSLDAGLPDGRTLVMSLKTRGKQAPATPISL